MTEDGNWISPNDSEMVTGSVESILISTVFPALKSTDDIAELVLFLEVSVVVYGRRQ